MDATISLSEKEFTHELLDKLKATFSGKKFKIEVEDEIDETDFILSNEAYAEELIKRIQSVENKTADFVSVKPEELP